MRLASEDGHIGHKGYVTDLLSTMLAGDDATSAAVYSCGPPAMLDAVAKLCAAREGPSRACHGSPDGLRLRRLLRLRGSQPRGFSPPRVDGPVITSHPRVAGGGGSRTTPPAAPPPPLTGPAAESPDPEPIHFCGIELRHPVINASGTFDAVAARRVYGDALLDDFPFSAFVSKTITPEPRIGNQPQRIWETPAGMINSIGLPNKGLEGFLGEDLPQLAELPVPLIVSVMGDQPGGVLATGRGGGRARRGRRDRAERVLPQRPLRPDRRRAARPRRLALLEALRPLTEKPLIVKLTPNVADPAAVAVAAAEGGAEAVSLINTLKASAIDPATGRPGIAAGHGGLSGPAVRPIAVAQLRTVAAAVSLPIIGMGGVSTAPTLEN